MINIVHMKMYFDVVTKGVNGELVQPKNVEALYRKMKDWIDHRDHVSELAKGCRNYVLTHYSSEDVMKAYYEELKSLARLKA